MRIPRIYQPGVIPLQQDFALAEDGANHIGRVLRMQAGDKLCLFNGDGKNYQAVISAVEKKQLLVKVINAADNLVESPLKLHLGQGISRGDRMDFVIQKAVELGVTEITPLFTERCGVKLDAERLAKRTEQWQKIAIAACEQSGRSVVPLVHSALQLHKFTDKGGSQANIVAVGAATFGNNLDIFMADVIQHGMIGHNFSLAVAVLTNKKPLITAAFWFSKKRCR